MKAVTAQPAETSASLASYLLLGMLVLVLAMIAQAPASLLKKALPASLPIQVDAWGGTVWNGQADWHQGSLQGQLAWTLRPAQLLLGRAAADVRLSGDVALTTRLSVRPGGAWALDDVNGRLPVALVQPWLPAGWNLPGELQAEHVALARAKLNKAAWRQAGGSLHWAGGPMNYSVNGQAQSATLPPLTLDLRQDNDTLVLTLQEAAGKLGLATVRLGPDDMLETQLRQRLLAYSPGYHGEGSPDQVVVTAKQPL
jgi:general secretion pathway protein N